MVQFDANCLAGLHERDKKDRKPEARAHELPCDLASSFGLFYRQAGCNRLKATSGSTSSFTETLRAVASEKSEVEGGKAANANNDIQNA